MSKIKYEDNPSVPLAITTTPAAKIWDFNKTLRIVFLNGTANQKNKVKEISKLWLKAIPLIKFKFLENSIHGDILSLLMTISSTRCPGRKLAQTASCPPPLPRLSISARSQTSPLPI